MAGLDFRQVLRCFKFLIFWLPANELWHHSLRRTLLLHNLMRLQFPMYSATVMVASGKTSIIDEGSLGYILFYIDFEPVIFTPL